MLAKQITGGEFLAGTGMDAVHVGYHFLQTDAFSIAQGTAAINRKAGPEHHSVIGVLRRGDDLFFETARRLIHHQVDQAIRNILQPEFFARFLAPLLQ